MGNFNVLLVTLLFHQLMTFSIGNVDHMDHGWIPIRRPLGEWSWNRPIQTSVFLRSPFPLQDFLNVTGIPKLRWYGFQCYKQGYHSGCDCSKSCQREGNCCIDFLWEANKTISANQTNREALVTYKQKVLNSTKGQSCLPLFPFTNTGYHFIMVDTCMSNASLSDIDNCRDGSHKLADREQVPVLGEDDKKLYKNKYCAKCNFISRYQVKGIKISCIITPINPEDTVPKILARNNYCTAKADINYEYYILQCKPDLCTQEYATFCRLFAGNFKDYDSYKHRKNVYCHKCVSRGINGDVQPTGYESGPDGWSRVMDLNNIFNSYKSLYPSCPSDTIPDRLLKCIPKECGEGFHLKQGHCYPVTQKVRPKEAHVVRSNQTAAILSNQTTTIKRCLTQSGKGFRLFIFQNTGTLNDITNDSVKIFNQTWKVHFKNKTLTVLSWIEHENTSINLKGIFAQSTNNKDLNISKILLTSNTLQHSMYYGIDQTRAFAESKLCASVIKIPQVKNRPIIIGNNCIDWFKNGMENVTLNDINFQITFSNGTVNKAAFFCQQHHLHSSCFRENINPNNFTIGEDKTLSFYVPDGQYFQFKANEYIPTPNGFQICIRNKTNQYEQRDGFSEFSISFIGTTISILASVLFIIVFICIKEMQNTGGMYILVLVVVLLTCDVIFLITFRFDPYTRGCKWSGILLHWAFLLLFTWSIVVSTDIALQFSRNSTALVRSSTKKLCAKFVGCLSICTIIIVLIIGLNETDTLNFRYKEYCWLMDFRLFLIFYYIPAVLSYFTCLVCLFVVLYSIRKSKRHSKQTLSDSVSQHNVHLTKICIKLIIILGISEAISLIQIHGSKLTNSEKTFNNIFLTIYDVVRSLRGLMIFCVYLLNKRTIHLMRKKLRATHKFSETGTTSTSKTTSEM